MRRAICGARLWLNIVSDLSPRQEQRSDTRSSITTGFSRAILVGEMGVGTYRCPIPPQRDVFSQKGGKLITEDGPNGSSYMTKPLSFIRWISCGRMDANCSPRPCMNSAIDTRTRRCNAETMSSCVGSDIGMVPWKQRGEQPCVIDAPMLHVFHPGARGEESCSVP